MPLDIIPLDSLAEEHLQHLVEDQEHESKTIEFKSELPGSSYEEHKKFLAAVTSFTNTVGGDLIYGVQAPNGIAETVVGLTGDLDASIGRLENILRTGIQPRITVYNTRLIPLANGNKVLVFRISRSWALPHRVTLGAHDKFYGRNSTGKYELDVPQLRSLFLLSETTTDRIRNFRAERISLILSGQTPVDLAPGPKTVLHVVPFDAFSGGHSFDVSRIYDTNILPLRPLSTSGGFSSRHNFDGIVTYSVIGENTLPPSYLQLFRSGIMESVDTRRIRTYDNDQLMIPGTGWEDELLGVVRQCFDIQPDIGVTPPIVVMLSLLNVKGRRCILDIVDSRRMTKSTVITFLSLRLWQKVLPQMSPSFSSPPLMSYGTHAGIQEVLVTELMGRESQVSDRIETAPTGGFINLRTSKPHGNLRRYKFCYHDATKVD